jgi:hypothetical protein
VSGRGLSDRVILIAVQEDGATIVEPMEPACELALKPLEIVGPHLVDRDEDNQCRSGWGGRGLPSREGAWSRGENQNCESAAKHVRTWWVDCGRLGRCRMRERSRGR